MLKDVLEIEMNYLRSRFIRIVKLVQRIQLKEITGEKWNENEEFEKENKNRLEKD